MTYVTLQRKLLSINPFISNRLDQWKGLFYIWGQNSISRRIKEVVSILFSIMGLSKSINRRVHLKYLGVESPVKINSTLSSLFFLTIGFAQVME